MKYATYQNNHVPIKPPRKRTRLAQWCHWLNILAFLVDELHSSVVPAVMRLSMPLVGYWKPIISPSAYQGDWCTRLGELHLNFTVTGVVSMASTDPSHAGHMKSGLSTDLLRHQSQQESMFCWFFAAVEEIKYSVSSLIIKKKKKNLLFYSFHHFQVLASVLLKVTSVD